MPTAAQIKAANESARIARLKKYQDDIQQMYFDLIGTVSQAAAGLTLKDGVFVLSKYANLNSIINNELSKLTISIDTYLHQKVKIEYNTADINNDTLFDETLKRGGQRSELLNYRSEEAFKEFMKSVDDGRFKLSKRIFNYVGEYKQELEVGTGNGIALGKSAREIAADLRQYLLEPDMLFRRVRKDGVLKLSKPALDYNPGQGIYRSSFKNTMRVARTTTNAAYREADNTRYKNSPFVIGVLVKTSGSHPTLDICDELAGEYPTDFVFIGFHPQCLCYNIPILLTPAEYDKMENDMLAGLDITKIKYTKRPTPTGDQAKQWYQDNIERISNWTNKPWFITQNETFFNIDN